ncbi:MAG TPA: hypothetical protein VN205_11145 [Thermomonas sp.]|nr:hypothetical protein [Thermomonas sp.]
MNTNDRDLPIDAPAVDEQHWQAQERARRSARRGDADADAVELRIARALRRAPPVELPPDFAAALATLARVQADSAAVPEQAALEQRLFRGLVLVFALSAAVVVAWYGRGWVAELSAVLPGGGDAVGWSGAAAICLLANWGWGLLRTHLQRGTHATA